MRLESKAAGPTVLETRTVSMIATFVGRNPTAVLNSKVQRTFNRSDGIMAVD